jgi:signal transduction histidine kinase
VNRSKWFALAAFVVCIAAAAWFFNHFRQRHPGSYRDGFAQGRVSEWTPYGGVWTINDGVLMNRSDEQGAKLVTGSPDWQAYQVTSDVQMREFGGNVGIIVHATRLRRGIEAYSGYYASLQSSGSALLLGRTNDDHLDRQPVHVLGGIRPNTWFRLHVVVVGCHVAAQATNLETHQSTYAAMTDEGAGCLSKGQVGLRAAGRGGRWRNVQIAPATSADLIEIAALAGPALPPAYPVREDDYARMWEQYFGGATTPARDGLSWADSTDRPIPSAATVEIASLGSQPITPRDIRVRGVVTFTSPTYLQDTTGGLRLQVHTAESLNVGDEVEATGRLHLEGNEEILQTSQTRLLWDRTPLLPVSITPALAASGQLDSSLVELNGKIVSRDQRLDRSTVLHMEEDAQRFLVVVPSEVFRKTSGDWSTGSALRVRGICTASTDPTEGSFTLLAADSADVLVLSGPPWWSGWRLVQWVSVALAFIVTGIYLFLRSEQSKMHAVMNERANLAHDMHDTLAQSFAGVGYVLQSVRKSVGDKGMPETLLNDLDIACEMVTGAHREASASIAAMHPDAHLENDLLAMLEHATHAMVEGVSLPITLIREGDARRLSPRVNDVLFRVGMEAVSNVLRHANASHLIMALTFTRRQVTFRIEDDGVGTTEKDKEGFGIKGMHHRCQSIGATLEVHARPGAGRTVRISVPDRPPHLLRRLSLRMDALGKIGKGMAGNLKPRRIRQSRSPASTRTTLPSEPGPAARR